MKGPHLAQPVIQQVLLVLGQNQQGQLHALVHIQLAARQQRAEVDQQGRRLARHGRHRLELVDRLLGAQCTLQPSPRRVSQIQIKVVESVSPKSAPANFGKMMMQESYVAATSKSWCNFIYNLSGRCSEGIRPHKECMLTALLLVRKYLAASNLSLSGTFSHCIIQCFPL